MAPKDPPFAISAAAAQKLRALAADLQVAPETILDTATMLLETLLAYNRKGYSRATLRHAIFRNSDREIDIDIPAAADFFQKKGVKERQMAEALGKPAVELRVGGSALAEAGPHPLEAKLVDLTLKIDAIAAALQVLLRDIEPDGADASSRLPDGALAEMDSLLEPPPDAPGLVDDELPGLTAPVEPEPEKAPGIKPPATFGSPSMGSLPATGPERPAGAGAFANLDYVGDEPDAGHAP
ncbi:MAG TPA: hypothetical protein VEI97_20390 [bacterium]|nr:hypothetical protein [bacterium]